MTPASDWTPAIVGDHDHLWVERIGSPVERFEALARARASHGEIAAHFAGVEHVQRTGAVEGQIIGDVDEGVDGPQPDRGEPLLHPGRAWTVRDASHEAQRESRRKMGVLAGEVETGRHRAGEGARYRGDVASLETPKARGGEVAGDALDAHGVGTVRQQIDVDDGIGEAGERREGVADRGVLRQLQNALARLGNAKLGGRTQHAARFDAADDALAERLPARRNDSARRREDSFKAGPRVGRAADDLHQSARSYVDAADLQAIGVGMRLGLDDGGDDEILERGGRILNPLDLKADPRQRIDDLV